MSSPTDGFTRIGAGVLRSEAADQAIVITPTEARYVKLRILAVRGSPYAQIAEIKVTEGRRAGYTPLLARQPELLHLVRAMAAAAPAVEPAPTTAVPGADVASCAPVAPKAQIVLGRESRNVLVIERQDGAYTPARLQADGYTRPGR